MATCDVNTAYNHWKLSLHRHQSNVIQQNAMELKKQLNDANRVIIELQRKIQCLTSQMNSKNDSLKSMKNKHIKKAVERWTNNSLKYTFNAWNTFTSHQRRERYIIQKFVSR